MEFYNEISHNYAYTCISEDEFTIVIHNGFIKFCNLFLKYV